MEEAAMCVVTLATATAGVMPTKISSGVIRKPPPMPNIPDMKPTAIPIARIRKTLTGRSAMGRKICTIVESLSRRADHDGVPSLAARTAFCLQKSKAAGDREYSKSTAIGCDLSAVMAGLDPAIHVLTRGQNVDVRHHRRAKR